MRTGGGGTDFQMPTQCHAGKAKHEPSFAGKHTPAFLQKTSILRSSLLPRLTPSVKSTRTTAMASTQQKRQQHGLRCSIRIAARFILDGLRQDCVASQHLFARVGLDSSASHEGFS